MIRAIGIKILMLLPLSIILSIILQRKLGLYLHPKLHIPVLVSILYLTYLILSVKIRNFCIHRSTLVTWGIFSIFLLFSFVHLSGFFKETKVKATTKSAQTTQSHPQTNLLKTKHSDSSTPEKESTRQSDVLYTNLPWIAMTLEKKRFNASNKISVRGFILRNAALDRLGEAAIARVMISCCIADAIAIAIRIPQDSVHSYSPEDWYEIRGTLHHSHLKSKATWNIYANVHFIPRYILEPDSIVKITEAPVDPYLFFFPEDQEMKEQY